MSESKQPDPLVEGLEAIAAAAGDAETSAQDSSAETRFSRIEERLASIEPLLEQWQANTQLGQRLTDYVSDLRKEQEFFNMARYGIGFLAMIVVFILILILLSAIFHVNSPLFKAEPVSIAAFVIAMVSSIAFIIIALVKGIFRSTVERHADGYLPPALEKAIELTNKVWGKG